MTLGHVERTDRGASSRQALTHLASLLGIPGVWKQWASAILILSPQEPNSLSVHSMNEIEAVESWKVTT